MIYALIAVIVLPCLMLGALSCAAKRPTLGIVDGKLRPCPGSPNCVLSDGGDGAARIDPLTFQGDPEAAWQALKASVEEMGGTLREARDDYLWATFTTRLFRFTDDLECRLDTANGVIHVRSGSRVGHSDFGVNGRRVEALRAEFDPRLAAQPQEAAK